MKYKLSDIAIIQSGIYAKPELEGEVYYVQARHFDRQHQFNTAVKPDLKADGKIERHFLQPGDLLVAAKGYDHFAVEYKGIIKPAVASSMFIVVKLQDKKVLPAFLTWHINNLQTQKLLSDAAKGTALPSITNSDLGDLEIPIPSIEKQKLILQIHDLHVQENKLKEQINSLREKQIQQQIINAIK